MRARSTEGSLILEFDWPFSTSVLEDFEEPEGAFVIARRIFSCDLF